MSNPARPFRTSLTARLLSLSAAIALIGAGLLPVLGIPAMYVSVPILVTVVIAVVAMVLGTKDYPGTVGLLAATLPIAMWAYVLLALGCLKVYPEWAWAMIAAGLVPLGASLLVTVTARREAHAEAHSQAA